MNTKHTIIWVIIAVIVGVGGYYIGTKQAAGSGATAANTTGRTGTGGSFRGFGGAGGTGGTGGTAGGGFTVGQIVSVDTNSFTIQLGGTSGSKVVFFSGTTGISKTVSGSASDLAVGTNVMVAGTSNSDGSLTAQTIQIRPAGMATSTKLGQ